MIEDIFIIYADMNSTPLENMDAKLHYVGALQDFHRNADFNATQAISALFLEKPKRRINAAIENKMSLLDMADIPATTPDEKIIKLIASEMSKKEEMSLTLSKRDTYSNEFLLIDPDSKALMGLSQTAIDHFNILLNQELKLYQSATGQQIPEKFFAIHDCVDQGDIHLNSTEQILSFIRKTPIVNHPELSENESVLYKIIVCRILKKMLAHEDYIQHKQEIDRSRKVFDQFVTTELTKTFKHMPLDKTIDLIEDKSHANYFSDKVYRLPRANMREMGITYEHDIYFRITKRAKSENSIITKTIFDPKLNSADAAKDIGGIRFLNEDKDPEVERDETNILRYYMTRLYNDNNFAGNDDLDNAFPHGKNINEIGKSYSKENISQVLKFMHMDMRDKDILKIKTLREKSEGAPALYELDKDFFECYGCTDKYVLAQMDAVVARKNLDAKIAFDLSKKTKGEARLDLFGEVIKDGHPVYENFLGNINDLKKLYWCETKFGDINKKFGVLQKILDLEAKIKQDRDAYNANKEDKGYKMPKQKVLDRDGRTFEYSDQNGNTQKIILDNSPMDPSSGPIAYYKKDDIKGFYIEIDNHKIYINELTSLHRDFLERRKDSAQNQENKDRGERKGSGSSTRRDGKNQGRMYTKTKDFYLGEHQFMPERAIKNIKPMTVSEIYQYIKQIFVTLRLEHLITVDEIITMVQKNLIPSISAKNRVENTMTGSELIEAIKNDDSALPIGGTIEEKFMYELQHDRDIKPFIVNGKKIPGVFIYPDFAKRTKRNNLGFDSMERPKH